MINDKIKEMLEKYDIEKVDEFEPKFYIQNLRNGYDIQKKAIKNLFNSYSKEELILVENYNEIGVVEYVADNQYHIENNKIIIDED